MACTARDGEITAIFLTYQAKSDHALKPTSRVTKSKARMGKPIASTEDPAVAADVTERLNEDEDRREEDKWSA
jgi:hypothetical protein